MIKKIILTLVFLLVAITASFFIWRYYNYVKDTSPDKTFLLPRLELSDIVITSLTHNKMEMVAHLCIKNNLPFPFTVDSLQYKAFINNEEIMKDSYTKPIILYGSESSWISLPITILNNNLGSVLKAGKHINNDSAEYRMNMSFFLHQFPFKKHFSINISKYLPLISIPEIKAEHIDIDSLDFKRAVIHLVVSIKNKNVFLIKAGNIAYEVSIGGNQWVKGVIPGITEVKAKSDTILTLPVALSIKEVGHTLLDLLKRGENIKYQIHLTFRIESDNNMIKDSKVILQNEGSVKSLIRVTNKKT